MDNLQKFVAQVRSRLVVVLLINNLLILGDWWLMEHVIGADAMKLIITLVIITLLSLTLLPWVSTKIITQPTKMIWQAILHIAPDAANVPAPDMRQRSIGHELVANLVSHVYQLASVVDTVEKTSHTIHSDLKTDFIANAMPLPVVVLDKNQTVLFANKAMLDYTKRSANEAVGQNVYSMLDMSFSNEQTLDKWLAESKANAVVSTKTWERVRLNLHEGTPPLQFDLAAYYNTGNPQGFETMLVFFDHSDTYGADDQAVSFVSLAVHELRTPITLMRGYIEALEEDLDGKLTPETADFIHKMKVSAQLLTAFINNMLNVTRIESDALVLQLHEDKWPAIIQTALNDLALRARVQGIELVADVAADLPTVGVDRVSIYEVLINLIDNAIKYSTKSGESKKVMIKAYINSEGLVETTIQDQGVGIPASVLPNLFEKFYRSHRSKTQVGGTGLGLYLSKAIVEAHGGHIWVRSKEEAGSTFGFTIVPYAKLADEKKNGNNDISRGVHGWIKNHSLYSR